MSVPAPSEARTTHSMRFLPWMSPIRPSTGLSTAVARRFTVRIQVPCAGLGVKPAADVRERRHHHGLHDGEHPAGHRQHGGDRTARSLVHQILHQILHRRKKHQRKRQ